MPNLTAGLKSEYQQLWRTCAIRPNRAATVDALADRLVANQKRYQTAGKPSGVPWFVVGVIHLLEASGDFTKHLHNGDPLAARTVRVPAGRPATGKPPFTWESSAADAIQLKLKGWTDWSIPGTLYVLERYNGWGYRNRSVPNPYLWSFSLNYSKGKFVKDGVFDPNAVSAQCGAGVMLRRLAERGLADVGGGAPKSPVLRYSNQITAEGKRLQFFLNTFPGIALKPDGELGERSSNAFKQITGHYLIGDPRAKKP
jgi:lysozyme family protein